MGEKDNGPSTGHHEEETDNSTTKNRVNTRRRRTLQFMASAGLAGIAGCSGSGNQSDISGEEVHFVFDVANQDIRQLMDEVGQAFNEETGAVLNVEYTGFGAGRYERIIQLLQAGNPPEVASGETSNAITFMQNGLLEPLTDVMNSLVDQYGEPPANSRIVSDGEDYVVPWGMSYPDFWYRQDLNSQAGLEEDFVPNTWDNLEQYAEAVSNNTEVEGIYIPASESDPTQATLLSFLRSNNGQIARYENGEHQIAVHEGQHRERMIEVLEFCKNLYDNYGADGSGADWDTTSHAIAFESSGSNYFPGARTKNHVTHHDRSSSFAAAVKNVGHMPEGRSTMGRANTGPLQVFSDSQNTEAGKAFVEFLMSNEEYASRLPWGDAPVHSNPAFPGIRESDPFQSLLDSLPDAWGDEELERHMFEAPKHGVVNPYETDPPNPHWGAIAQTFEIAGIANDVYVGGKDPGQAIDDHAPAMQDALEQSKQDSS